MESDATSPQGDALAGNGSGSNPGLEGSAASTQASGAPGDNSAQRINDLMSKWQREEAESTRLRAELATAIAKAAELEQQLVSAKAGSQSDVETARTELTQLQGRVAELERENARLASENASLTFLADNPDLLSYRNVLPQTADAAALARAAETIRSARQAETDRLRGQLTTPPAGGGVPRKPLMQMSEKEIAAYLDAATDHADYEHRLKVVTGRAA